MKCFVALALLPAASIARAEPSLDPDRTSLAVNAGLLQPVVLGGANVEVDIRRGHLVVAYSHGWNLRLQDGTVTGDMKRQGIAMRLPFTTGVGVGYSTWIPSVRSFLDVRAEAKAHRFEVSYASSDDTMTSVTSYTTLTLGGGVYWTYLPFASRSDALRGFDISASVRYWPNVYSTLDGDRITYANARTGQMETHESANIGLANTPLIINLSVGYVFR